MYGVKFSLWLSGAVGPQAVAGRHSSTRPLAGGVYIESGRHGCWPPVFVHRHDTILAPTVQVFENSKTWLSIIICSLMVWIDLWCFFFKFRQVLKK